MAAKPSEEPQNLIQWLFERGEETVQDLLRAKNMTDGLSKVAQRAAKTRGRLDKNVEVLVHLLNLPSRADYQKLLLKIDHLQGSVVNLNMKLDRLLAAQERQKARSGRGS